MKVTASAKAADIQRKWYVLDAQDQVLGRLATKAAQLLTGKGKPIYTPHVDCGDHVIVVNADKIRVTGKKATDKIYYHHTGYMGHLKAAPLKKVLRETPERVIQSAIQGMVPKSRLGRKMLAKLKVYRGPNHPHKGQMPENIA